MVNGKPAWKFGTEISSKRLKRVKLHFQLNTCIQNMALFKLTITCRKPLTSTPIGKCKIIVLGLYSNWSTWRANKVQTLVFKEKRMMKITIGKAFKLRRKCNETDPPVVINDSNGLFGSLTRRKLFFFSFFQCPSDKTKQHISTDTSYQLRMVVAGW